MTYSLPSGHEILWQHRFFVGLHRDIDRLRFETEVISLYDIYFQDHNDVGAVTYAQCKTSGYGDKNFQGRIDIK